MAAYRICFKRSAVKELKALPDRDLKAVLKRIQGLAEEPRPKGCERLSGKEWYRLRCGVYRILYAIEDGVLTVLVVKIGHRREVYHP